MSEPWDNYQPFMNTTNLDIEYLKTEIGKHFPYYDIRFDNNKAAFYCRIDSETLEDNFNSLRKNLIVKGYIPMLRYKKGEHILYIIQKPKNKEKPIWVNIGLLIATVITTILTGSLLYLGYFDIWNMPNIMDLIAPVNLFFGALLFALPLMSILIIHEMGHYFISKKHGIKTSLPFFIPVPPIIPFFNIGTFGALISSREPIPDKKALFDIGISGPIAGFLVALPVTIIGIATSEIVPISQLTQGETVLGSSILFVLISDILLNIPKDHMLNLNPIAFAGWVGLLITSINLLPAGQLDGGHIFRAILGDKQKYASWAAVFIMIFTGWMFFAFLILFVIGIMHPPPLNDFTKIDLKRRLLFIVAILMLVLCYIPYPIINT